MATATDSQQIRTAAVKQLQRQIIEEEAVKPYSVSTARLGLSIVAAIAFVGVLGGMGQLSNGDGPQGMMMAAVSAGTILSCLIVGEFLAIGAAILKELRVQRILISRLVNGRPLYPAVEDYNEATSGQHLR